MIRTFIIAAITSNYAIGKNNDLVVKIKADMDHFIAETTLPETVLVTGRLNYETFPVRPLPGRITIVITRDKNYLIADGMYTAPNLDEAIKMAHTLGVNIAIIGGGQIYKQALESKDMVDELIITHIDKVVEDADVFFPVIDPEIWMEVERSEIFTTVKGTSYYFARYVRK